MAINEPFVAISRSGGSKMVDQHGSRLDQGRTHLGGRVGTIFQVRNGYQRLKLALNGPFVGIGRRGGSIEVKSAKLKEMYCSTVTCKNM